MRYLRTFLFLFFLADLIALLSFWAPARLFGLRVLGRTGGCEVSDTLHNASEVKTENDLKQYFTKNRRVVERTPEGIELWDTPRGRIWSPAKDRIIPYILAEQEMKPVPSEMVLHFR